MMTRLNQILDKMPMHIITIIKIIQGENFPIKLIDLKENVVILLIIIKPITNKFKIFKYGFSNNSILN